MFPECFSKLDLQRYLCCKRSVSILAGQHAQMHLSNHCSPSEGECADLISGKVNEIAKCGSSFLTELHAAFKQRRQWYLSVTACCD